MAQAMSGEAGQELALHRRLMQFGKAETTVAPAWVSPDTSVAAVAAHLAELWTADADDADERLITEKGMPHARASVLNLIVTVADAAAAERVVQTMLGLGMRHPSRAIVLVADPSGARQGIDASVTAHCHSTAASGDQVCYEEVVLGIRGEAAQHLAGVVAPLLIHDLPTYVWWPGDPPFADPIFDQMVEVGDRLIVDAGDFSDLLLGMRRMAGLRRQSGIGDLAWKRLARWQELTAQFFDAPRFRRYLPNLSRLVIRYAADPGADAAPPPPGCRSPLAQALLFAGWIASRLAWKRYRTDQPLVDGRLHLTLEGKYEMVELRIEPEAASGLPPGELLSIRLASLGETGAAEFIIDRDGAEAVVASNADGMTALLRRVHVEPPSESELLATSLVADRREEVYEQSLRSAAILLASARAEERAGPIA